MNQRPTTAQLSADVLILGAGMCGLTAAKELVKAGQDSFLVIDKGRSVGGRMATRRLDGQKFDHGAQFFTARSDLFKRTVAEWLSDHTVKVWNNGFRKSFEPHTGSTVHDGHPRYIGQGGMNQIAKYLAEKIPPNQILLGEKITKIEMKPNTVILTSESGQELTGKSLVITSPLPQTLDLLKSMKMSSKIENLAKELEQIQYDPCIAFIGFFGIEELPIDEIPIQSASASISFLADNFSKGITSEKGTLTIHLSGNTSRQLFEADDLSIMNYVLTQLKFLLKTKNISAPRSYSIQRWRYASPTTTLNRPFLEWDDLETSGPKIYFAGEAFNGPKIEGAYLSGFAVAQRMIQGLLNETSCL